MAQANSPTPAATVVPRGFDSLAAAIRALSKAEEHFWDVSQSGIGSPSFAEGFLPFVEAVRTIRHEALLVEGFLKNNEGIS